MVELFDMGFHLHNYVENIKNDINNRINSMDENKILSSNENECIQYLNNLFQVKLIELYPEKIYYTKKSRTIYKKDLPRRISFNPYETVEVPNIVYSIPFKGDIELLKYSPSHYQLPPKKFYIKNNCICFELLKLDDDVESFKREVDKSKDYLTIMFENMNTDVIKINRDLEIYIKNTFKNKKETLIKENDFFASLDIPESNSEKIHRTETYSVPINFQDKISINFNEISELNPTLDYKTYNKLLNSIYKYCSSFEQHPEICKPHNEESIRDLILAHLTSITDETVAAEAINRSGKTDLLVKHSFHNIFVAECKIWYGKKAYLDAITQLLSYLTWKDSKTAIIIFVRNQGMSHVLNEIKKHTSSHANFKRFNRCYGENWFEYEFFNDDIAFFLSVLVFKID